MNSKQFSKKSQSDAKDVKHWAHHFLREKPDKVRWKTIASKAEELRRKGEWGLLHDLLKFALSDRSMPHRAVELFLMALRAEEDQLNALKYLREIPNVIEDIGVATQWASMLCELGDFSPILSIQETALAGTPNQVLDFLILIAWAHENTQGIEQAQKSASLYERVSSGLKREASSEDYESPHPEATTKLHGVERNMNAVRTLWALRGYADSLSRLPDRKDEAPALWTGFVNDASRLSAAVGSDPYVQSMVAWVHFRLKNYEESLKTYREALQAGFSKYRPQFEQALVVFLMGRVNAALDLYEKAIGDLHAISTVRRGGLLRLGLFQFLRALLDEPSLCNRIQARDIVEAFRTSLNATLTELRTEIPEHVERIEKDLATIFTSLEELGLREGTTYARSPLNIVTWSEATIVGFQNPGGSMCGVFPPVIEYRGHRFTCIVENLPSGGPARGIQLKPAPLDIQSLPPDLSASPTTAILYFSTKASKVLDGWNLRLPKSNPSPTSKKPGSTDGIAYFEDASNAVATMDKIAKDLIQKSFGVCTGGTILPESLPPDLTPLLAFFAAQERTTVYQAALLYHCVAQESPIDLHGAREDGLSATLPSTERLKQLSMSFYDFVKTIPFRDSASLGTSAMALLAHLIIKRVSEISDIREKDRRAVEAVWAAAEVQLLLGNSAAINSFRKELSESLQRATMLYLTDDLSIVTLAQEPAFYCAAELSNLGKPRLDVYSFYKMKSSHFRSANERSAKSNVG